MFCLSGQDYTKTTGWIIKKLVGRTLYGSRKNPFNFGDDPNN